MRRRRRTSLRILLITAVATIPMTLVSAPAAAEITSGGGCVGDATIAGVNYTQDTPQDTPVVMPAEDAPPADLIVPYKGHVTFDNRSHSGNFALMFGPFPIPIVDWGDDNTDGDAATGPPTSAPGATEMYDLADAYDTLPSIRGQFRVRGTHSAMGGSCTGMYVIEFPGGAFDSPVTIVGVVGAGLSAVLIVLSGRRRVLV